MRRSGRGSERLLLKMMLLEVEEVLRMLVLGWRLGGVGKGS